MKFPSLCSLVLWILALHLAAGSALASTVKWTGSSGDWGNAANWSGGAVPGPSDDVLIDTSLGNITVTISSGTNRVNSLQCQEPLVLSGGILAVASTIQMGTNLTVNGGSIQGTTVNLSGGCALVASGSGGTLNGVTVNGTLDAGNSVNGSSLTVTNGLVLNGTAWLGNTNNGWWGGIWFAGSQALSGNGTVVFGNSAYNAMAESIAGSSLIIGSAIVVHGQNGMIGAAGYPWSGPTNVLVVNQGTITEDTSPGTITIKGQSVANSGTLGMANGGNLSIANLTDASGLVAAGGGTLTLSEAWGNSGTLQINGSTLLLAGNASSANFGVIAGTKGVIMVSGSVNNANSQWVVGTGLELELAGGSIIGGILVATNAPGLVVNGSAGVLDDVTLVGTLDAGNSINGSVVIITNGLVLNGTALVGNPTNNWWGGLSFGGSQVLGGSGKVAFGNAGYNGLVESVGGSSLVMGPGITVQGGLGTIGGFPTYPFYGPTNVSVVNQGSIVAGTSGQTIYLRGQSVANSGTLGMANWGESLRGQP